jgi:AraC-like DNA-binding protein
MRHCVARTGCGHFGLLVGQRAGLGSLGLVGLLAKYESDVGAALRSLVRFLHLHGRGAGLTLAVDGDTARLTYDIHEPEIEAVDQIGDGALAILFNILRALCGPQWRPVAVRFAHRRPPDIRPFQYFFGAPLQFDDEHHALEFAADWLRRPLSEADPELRSLLRERAAALAQGRGDHLADQVRAILHPALLAGRCTADRVAALLALHVRTLNRRLRADGTSFRSLADEVRHEIARQLLGDTALDVTEVATALGYADASAFRRAFRRWTGSAPSQWRRQRRPA